MSLGVSIKGNSQTTFPALGYFKCYRCNTYVSSGMGDHVWVQFSVPDIYLGM